IPKGKRPFKSLGQVKSRNRARRRVGPILEANSRSGRPSYQGEGARGPRHFKAVLAMAPLVKGAPAKARAGKRRTKPTRIPLLWWASPTPRNNAPLARAWWRAKRVRVVSTKGHWAGATRPTP